jgi:hypothetical protein
VVAMTRATDRNACIAEHLPTLAEGGKPQKS